MQTTDDEVLAHLPRVEAVDRALTLLLALADAGPGGASLADLAAATGMNKSTAYRSLSTMRRRGFAGQSSDTGFYRLGRTAMTLDAGFLAPGDLAGAMHPALLWLSRASDELVHLGVWEDDQVLYVAKVEPQRAIQVRSFVGRRAPLATTSLGRAMLAARGLDDAQLAVYGRPNGNAAGPAVEPARLGEIVREAQGRGYATEFEENEAGVACLGMALLRGGDVIGAVSITAMSDRLGPERQVELAALMRAGLPELLPEGVELMAAGSR
ncbi:IclR family transcriptional regulator [Nigerium massiliense]|uniref:IclR family transcriptional regulator n=1 Tax=Nigerium massiliense TaxID=1522317 RepID=UPI0005917507|nr:IclR family transcriptional regulator [Nigerium massiliense]